MPMHRLPWMTLQNGLRLVNQPAMRKPVLGSHVLLLKACTVRPVWWAIYTGQLEDIEAEGERILHED